MQLLRQYRLDVAVISFGAYIFGAVASGGIKPSDILVGLGISLVSFNYIYSFNAIEDREIDRVNKPSRPNAAGAISLYVARRYVAVLLVVAVIYPFFVARNAISLALFLLLPALGWAYSAGPFRLKTKAVPAAVSIALMYMTPIAIGLARGLEPLHAADGFLLGYFFLFCLSIVPLKDIEDVEGDQQLGSANWLAAFGLPRLLAASLTGLAASIVVALVGGLGPIATTDFVALSGSVAALIGGFLVLRLPAVHLYRAILILLACLAMAFFVVALLHGGSL